MPKGFCSLRLREASKACVVPKWYYSKSSTKFAHPVVTVAHSIPLLASRELNSLNIIADRFVEVCLHLNQTKSKLALEP